MRRPEERAGGARGVRLGRHAHLLRAPGHADLRRPLRLPAAGDRQRALDSIEDVYRRERAERLLSFLDSKRYPYLHLADGAFADNLGARAILDEVALGDTVTDALRRNGYARARRMLFVIVDARTGFDRRYAQVAEPLGIKKVMDAVVSATFNRYSFETMNLMRQRVKRWENEVRTTRCKSSLPIPDCDEFDIDLVELNEAFASQVLYCQRTLGIPDEKLNQCGGSIAIGHPFGMTGSRLTGLLLRQLKRQGKRYGIVTMCIGGGQGFASLFESA